MIFRLDHAIHDNGQYEDFDAEQRPTHHAGGLTYDIPDFPYQDYLPDIMEFDGHLERLSRTDYPRTNPTLPLMSPRMLQVCLSAGAFPYEAHPTVIHGHGSDVIDSFVNVHLTTWTTALDLDRTLVAQRDPAARRMARRYVAIPARQLDEGENLDLEAIEVLRIGVPEADLPGLFRMEQLYGLFCSERTKQACEEAGLRGVTFTPVPVPLGQGARPYLQGFRLVSAEDLPRD
ncbi:hypothetical protein ACMT4L_14025 [Deinococcus sp. A31D244]|uniref:hypothetical protein n=1 Tax=Deinococcus sp. A31D244 TaxID=3397675 RepID=UPI0039E040E3